MSFYEPGMRLDVVIDEAINAFANERRAYWEQNDEGLRGIKTAEALAGLLLEPSDDLTSSRGSDQWEFIRELVEDVGPTDPTYEALELKIAEKFLPAVRDMASRCLHLIQLPLDHEPNPVVREFLKKVARCYIAGFVPECAVMCRAAMENGLKECFSRADLPLPATPENRSPFSTRLAAGVRFGLFSKEGADKMKIVWTRGSKSAHEDASLLADARDTIRLTAECLDEMYSRR